MTEILIYGPGCARCEELAHVTEQAVVELGLNCSLKKVTHAMELAAAGVLTTPALAVDGRLLVSGRVPSKEEMMSILQSEISGKASCACRREKEEAKDALKAEGISCCCGGKKSCGNASDKCCGWKRAVVWVVALLLLLAAVKLVNRRNHLDGESAVSAAEPVQSGVELAYFEYGARCPTCIRMETWTKEAIEKNFSTQLEEGKLAFRAVPADKGTANKYELTTKSLIMRYFLNGKEMRWENLDRIWDLSGNEREFKEYVTQSIRKALQETP